MKGLKSNWKLEIKTNIYKISSGDHRWTQHMFKNNNNNSKSRL